MDDSLFTLDIDGRTVPLRVRRNARARRLILRLDDETGGAVVTIPKRTAIQDAISMAKRQSAWIAAQIKRTPERVAFEVGARVPFRGEEMSVCHDPFGLGISAENGEIRVSGRAEHLSRRLTDWLKTQAKTRIEDEAQKLAQILDFNYGSPSRPLRVRRVTVRDTRSRWGSCTIDGKLNFSWRLIFAPDYVLQYVVAHEVAHLMHRDHSPQFWAITDELAENMKEAKAWLNTFGRSVHRYG